MVFYIFRTTTARILYCRPWWLWPQGREVQNIWRPESSPLLLLYGKGLTYLITPLLLLWLLLHFASTAIMADKQAPGIFGTWGYKSTPGRQTSGEASTCSHNSGDRERRSKVPVGPSRESDITYRSGAPPLEAASPLWPVLGHCSHELKSLVSKSLCNQIKHPW